MIVSLTRAPPPHALICLHTCIQIGFEDISRVAADKRLRNTNWAGEAAALLPDEQQLVKDAKLSSGDLLLLEDGMAPQKGALLVKVHLWARPPAAGAAGSTAESPSPWPQCWL